MVNHKAYGKKISRRHRKVLRISTYIVIVFIFFGLAINAVPMLSFYFGTYIHDSVHNPTANGTELQYYGFYGAAPGPNLTGYGYGFEVFITGIGNERYHIVETVYNISGKTVGLDIKAVQTAPFIGNIITKVYTNSSDQSYQDCPFLQLTLPKNTTPVANYLTLRITGGTSEYAAEAYLGYPLYIDTNTTSGSLVNYVAVDGQYILANFEYATDFGTFFHTLDPSAKVLPANLTAVIVLGSGNVAISQNWFGWVSYGYNLSFPVNVALLVVGGLLAITEFRRGI